MNKRLRTLLIPLLGLSLVAAACGDDDAEDTSNTTGGGAAESAAPSGDATSIKLVAAEYTPEMQAFYDTLVTDFEAANPDITVEVEVVSWNDIDQKIKTLVQTGEVPDIANLNYFASFAADDLLYPADQIVSPEVLEDIVPTFRENSKYEGTEFAVPDLASDRLFFYNKTVLEAAGVSEPPATWADLEAAAEKIKATQPDVIPLALPLGPEEAQAEFIIWAGSNGGSVFTDGEWTLDSPENVEAMEFLKGLVDKGYTQPSPGTTNRTDGAFPLFAQGKAAMMNGAIFFPGELEKAGSTVDWGVATIPANEGKDSITLGVQDYFFGFKKDGNQVPIQKFLDFLFVPENYAKFLEAAGGFLPATVSAGAQADPSLKPFVDALPSAIFYPSDQKAWPATQGALQQQIGTAVQSGGDPAAVLGAIQSEAEAAS